MVSRVRAGKSSGVPQNTVEDEAEHNRTNAAANTPSQSIIGAASGLTKITTPEGNTVTLRRLGIVDQMRLTRALGADASNEAYFMWCIFAAGIANYNGTDFPIPASAAECEFIVERVGDDTFMAVQRYGEAEEAKRKAPGTDSETAFRDAVKK